MAGQLERGGERASPDGGLSLNELVTAFLTTWDGFAPRTPDGGRVAEFVHKNSSALSAGLKDLGLVQRKIGKQQTPQMVFCGPRKLGGWSGGRGSGVCFTWL